MEGKTMANLMMMKSEGTITHDTDGRFTLRATKGGRFQFAYVYDTREAAEMAARKYKLVVQEVR
jgi:hypothetical protein